MIALTAIDPEGRTVVVFCNNERDADYAYHLYGRIGISLKRLATSEEEKTA